MLMVSGEKISKYQAKRLQKAYRDSHQECWNTIQVNGVLRFCRQRPTVCDHIPHGSGKREGNDAYYPYCQPIAGGCHLLVKHQWQYGGRLPGDIMLDQLAVKFIMGDLDLAAVPQIMADRRWWNEGMGDIDVKRAVLDRQCQYVDLYKSELPRWTARKGNDEHV